MIRLRILGPVCFAALVATGAVAAPEVTVSAPSVGAYISGSDPDPYPISAAAAPEEGTSVEFFRCDDASVDCAGGTWVSIDSDATAPFSVLWPLDPDGNRALRAVATDTTGSTTSPIVNVVIDRAAPAGGLTAPADNSFVAGAETLNANPTDPVSGVASVEFQRSPAGTGNWTTIATDSAAPWAAAWNTTSVPDGEVDLRVVKTDEAGNSESSAVRTVRVDNSPPSGVSVSYPDGYDPNGSITVGFANGTDAGSGVAVASARLERRSANLAEGACSPFGDWTVVANPNTVASGDCAQYRYSVADALGNRAEAASPNVVKVDLTAPPAATIDLVENEPDEHAPGATLFYNPATGNGGSFTVSATSSDPESGIGSVVFPDVFGADGATDSAGPHSHAYQWTNADGATGQKAVILRNNAGLERNATFAVTPDTAGPAGGSVSYQNGYNATGSITVTIGPGTDGGAGINAASASLERRTTTLLQGACGAFPASWTAANSPDSVPSGSCVQYRYSVGDNVGNETSYLSTAVARVDTSIPAVANLAPAPTAGAESQYFEPGSETLYFRPVGTGSFTLRATVSDPESGDDRVNFPNFDALPGWTAAGGADVTGPGPYASPAYAWSGAAASPGARVVRGQNNAGLGANTTITITADSADPSGGSVTYPNGYDKDGVAAVTGTAGTDALSGIDPTTARLERGVSNLASGTCPAPASWTALTGNSDTVANGQCARYRYRVSDRVGNEAIYTSPNVVRVDAAAPSPPGLTLTESSPHAAVTGSEIFVNTAQTGSFEVAATVSDPDSGIDKVQFPARPDDSAPPFEATYTFLDLTGGQTVTAFDAAGNTASSPFTVTPDTNGPSGGGVLYTNGFDADGIVAITTSDGSDSSAGIAPASRSLERRTAPLNGGACGTYGAWAEVTSPNTVASGSCAQYQFRVADRVGNETLYTSTSVVKVDRDDPVVPKLTLSESSPFAVVSATEIFVNTDQTGSFGVAAITSDLDSGVAKVRFPERADDTTLPYETSYAFNDLAGVQAVTAFDGAGNNASSAFEVTPDTAGPIGGSVSYPNGYVIGGRVTVTIKNGADLSGISSRVLERDTARLVGTTCDPFTGTWATVPNPDTLPPNTCARYRVRVSDRVGNETVHTSPNVARVDNSAPAAVTGASAAAGDHLVTLRWTRPADTDFAAVRIVRKSSGSSPIQVYLGPGAGFRDASVSNGVRYTYELTSRDGSGNQSNRVVLAATPRNPFLVSPRDGAVVSRPPLLDWRRRTGATYYNVQLWRNGVKILSVHPTLSQYRLRSSWRFNGRARRLTAGRYRWYVWPGLGRPAAVRFGKLLGWSEFTKRN